MPTPFEAEADLGADQALRRTGSASTARNPLNCTFLPFRLYNRCINPESSVTVKAQRKATSSHRRRAVAKGLVRVEVQAAKADAGLIRALAETLRTKPEKAKALRSTLEKALVDPNVETAFDVFGSDLPDEAFAGVFDQKRPRDWRKIDL